MKGSAAPWLAGAVVVASLWGVSWAGYQADTGSDTGDCSYNEVAGLALQCIDRKLDPSSALAPVTKELQGNAACLNKAAVAALRSLWDRGATVTEAVYGYDRLVDWGIAADKAAVARTLAEDYVRAVPSLRVRDTAVYSEVLARADSRDSKLQFYWKILEQGAGGSAETEGLLTWLAYEAGFEVRRCGSPEEVEGYLARERPLFEGSNVPASADGVRREAELVLLLEKIHDSDGPWWNVARESLVQTPPPLEYLFEAWVNTVEGDSGGEEAPVARVIGSYLGGDKARHSGRRGRVMGRYLLDKRLAADRTMQYDAILNYWSRDESDKSVVVFYKKVLSQGAGGDTNSRGLLSWLARRGFKVTEDESEYLDQERRLFEGPNAAASVDDVWRQAEMVISLETIHQSDPEWNDAAPFDLITEPAPTDVLMDALKKAESAGTRAGPEIARAIKTFMRPGQTSSTGLQHYWAILEKGARGDSIRGLLDRLSQSWRAQDEPDNNGRPTDRDYLDKERLLFEGPNAAHDAADVRRQVELVLVLEKIHSGDADWAEMAPSQLIRKPAPVGALLDAADRADGGGTDKDAETVRVIVTFMRLDQSRKAEYDTALTSQSSLAKFYRMILRQGAAGDPNTAGLLKLLTSKWNFKAEPAVHRGDVETKYFEKEWPLFEGTNAARSANGVLRQTELVVLLERIHTDDKLWKDMAPARLVRRPAFVLYLLEALDMTGGSEGSEVARVVETYMALDPERIKEYDFDIGKRYASPGPALELFYQMILRQGVRDGSRVMLLLRWLVVNWHFTARASSGEKDAKMSYLTKESRIFEGPNAAASVGDVLYQAQVAFFLSLIHKGDAHWMAVAPRELIRTPAPAAVLQEAWVSASRPDAFPFTFVGHEVMQVIGVYMRLDTSTLPDQETQQFIRETALSGHVDYLKYEGILRRFPSYITKELLYWRFLEPGAKGDTIQTKHLLEWLVGSKFRAAPSATEEEAETKYLSKETLLFEGSTDVANRVRLVSLLQEIHKDDKIWTRLAPKRLVTHPLPPAALFQAWIEEKNDDRAKVILRIIHRYMGFTVSAVPQTAILARVKAWAESGSKEMIAKMDRKGLLPLALPSSVASWSVPRGFATDLWQIAESGGLVNTAKLSVALAVQLVSLDNIKPDWNTIYSKTAARGVGAGDLASLYMPTSMGPSGNAIDWRKHVNGLGCASDAMLSQGSCGTCWANAMTTVIGMRMCLMTQGAFGMQASLWSVVEAIKYGSAADDKMKQRMEAYRAEFPPVNPKVAGGRRVIDHYDEVTRRQIMSMSSGLVLAGLAGTGHGFDTVALAGELSSNSHGVQPQMCNAAKCKQMDKDEKTALGNAMQTLLRKGTRMRSAKQDDGTVVKVKAPVDEEAAQGIISLRWKLKKLMMKSGSVMPATRDDILDDREVCNSPQYGIRMDPDRPSTVSLRKHWSQSVNEIEQELYQHGPVGVSVNWNCVEALLTNSPKIEARSDDGSSVEVTLGMRSQAWDECGTPARRGHAVVLVGFQTAQPVDYWIFQNSWGKEWEAGGYFYLQKGAFKGPSSEYPVKEGSVDQSKDYFALDGNTSLENALFGPRLSHESVKNWMDLNQPCRIRLGIASCGDGYCSADGEDGATEGKSKCVCASTPFDKQDTPCEKSRGPLRLMRRKK